MFYYSRFLTGVKKKTWQSFNFFLLLEISYNLKEKIRKKSFMNTILEKLYKDYQVKPFISPERDLDAWLLNPKSVPKWNKRQSSGRWYYPPLENQLWYFYHRKLVFKTPIRIWFKIRLKSMFSHFFRKNFSSNLNNFQLNVVNHEVL